MTCYLSDKTVGGGVGGGASIGALESALPLGVLSLSVEERGERPELKTDCVAPWHQSHASSTTAAKTRDESGVGWLGTGLMFHRLAQTGEFNLIGKPLENGLFEALSARPCLHRHGYAVLTNHICWVM